MGIIKDLRNIHKSNNDLIRIEVERERNGESIVTIFDYINKINIIDKKGFYNCGVTFQDLMNINQKHDLRLKEEQISEIMKSEKQLYNFILLPIPRRLVNDIYMDIYHIMKSKGELE